MYSFVVISLDVYMFVFLLLKLKNIYIYIIGLCNILLYVINFAWYLITLSHLLSIVISGHVFGSRVGNHEFQGLNVLSYLSHYTVESEMWWKKLSLRRPLCKWSAAWPWMCHLISLRAMVSSAVNVDENSLQICSIELWIRRGSIV